MKLLITVFLYDKEQALIKSFLVRSTKNTENDRFIVVRYKSEVKTQLSAISYSKKIDFRTYTCNTKLMK
jgi:hypothetical protein